MKNISILLLFVMVLAFPGSTVDARFFKRQLRALVPSAPLVLDYHGGHLLSGKGSLLVYLVWYGGFTPMEKSVAVDFIDSLNRGHTAAPSVKGFWQVVSSYVDASKTRVKSRVKLGGQISIPSSGKVIQRSDIPKIMSKLIASGQLPSHTSAIYVLLTAADVAVERFCMSSCATHSYMNTSSGTHLPYAWVGNSATQCPGMCAWPFARALYGPPDYVPLVAPNGNVGMDGLVINLALMLAGTATNPFGDGYYQGDPRVPLESGTACQGIFGEGSYPGYPGELMVDKVSGASFNAEGVNNRKFLLPAVWSPKLQACTTSFA